MLKINIKIAIINCFLTSGHSFTLLSSPNPRHSIGSPLLGSKATVDWEPQIAVEESAKNTDGEELRRRIGNGWQQTKKPGRFDLEQ
jgi:hypothetical protein